MPFLIGNDVLPGYIDLSKRRVSPEDIIKCEERYMKSKAVASILRHVASKVPSLSGTDATDGEENSIQKEVIVQAEQHLEGKKATRKARQVHGEDGAAADGEHGIAAGSANEEERLEQLYEQTAWPLGKKYGHPYDAFKLALTYFTFKPCIVLAEAIFFFKSEPDVVFSSLPTRITPSILSILISTIARRLTPQPIKLRADIELTCYTPAGIDAIKKALRAGEKQSNEAVPIKAKLVAPPLYVLSTNSTDKVRAICFISFPLTIIIDCQHAAVDRLERAIDAIQNTVEKYGGSLIVKMKVLLVAVFNN